MGYVAGGSPSILVVKKSEGLVGLQQPSVSCSEPELTFRVVVKNKLKLHIDLLVRFHY